ncbi:glycogen-binding domain-containing protein [Spirochaeta africana]|uniref:Putative carbohydrate binding protein n=1 Tax=Spirochaeta africana (strain ATCC 700263 / DSM 8902 / Z-7692) TaxID=889378 RepID=H9UKR8_SPIAZ|nr:glycogen-binding domain-containing protein [Spirochaeta africana]AFG38111.1 putative carbohydrate binding protein [Spirochaeta africana DSM 8902]
MKKVVLFSVLAVLVMAMTVACATGAPERDLTMGNIYEAGPITFAYYGEAEEVVLAGSFTGWAPDDLNWAMDWNGEYFELTVDLPAGNHQYKYVIDGEWTEPTAILEYVDPIPTDATDDGFGGENAVLELQ